MTLERGTLLNKRYRIVDILGQGGMASVYRAVDDNLGVEVAVKENFFTTEEYARQFRLEAVILASLRHQNMPRVTDHFVINGQGQYLVMDYIEGEDLRQRMDRVGTLSEEEIIITGAAICDALTYLHSRQPTVLHRDIKPGNVKINPNGEVYLVDFGLAKVVDDANITTTGARAMTPGYSPPEQYGTARTDPRSDIYSLGATLYSAATDALPEDGLSRAMEQASLTPLRDHNPRISKRLAFVIEKALEVRPDDRHQSADAFKQALINARGTSRRRAPLQNALSPPPDWFFTEGAREGIEGFSGSFNPSVGGSLNMAGEGVLSPSHRQTGSSAGKEKEISSRKREKRRSLWFSFLALGLILVFFAFYYANAGLIFRSLLPLSPGPSPSTTQPGTQQASSTPTEDLAEDGTPALAVVDEPTQAPFLNATPSPTWSPTFSPTFDLTTTPLGSPVPLLTPTLSPTLIGGGRPQFAFASDRSSYMAIWLMNIDGTGLRQLTFIEEGACQSSWSPDGSQIVFISPCPRYQESYPASSLFIINADGGDLTPIATAPGGDYNPAWSPDGNRIAFTSLRRNNNAQIFILDLETFEVTILPDPDGRQNFQPAWSPDGKTIAYVGPRNQIWTMDADGSNRYLLSRPSDFTNRFPSWSPNGRTVVFAQLVEDMSGTPWLAAVDSADEGAIAHIIARDVHMTEASYSPDGFWIIYQSRQGGYRDIYIMSHNGVNRQRLTDDEFNNFSPAWRPSTDELPSDPIN